MGLFAAAPFLGPVLGPIVGGFVSQYGTSPHKHPPQYADGTLIMAVSWRWTFWVALIFAWSLKRIRKRYWNKRLGNYGKKRGTRLFMPPVRSTSQPCLNYTESVCCGPGGCSENPLCSFSPSMWLCYTGFCISFSSRFPSFSKVRKSLRFL
jgi:MFS family permease